MGMDAVGQLNQILTDEVNSTLPGYIKLFGDKFKLMGESANQLALTAVKHFGTVNTGLLLMQTNASSFFKVFDAVMKNSETSAKTLGDKSKTHFGTVNTAILGSQTNVSSLYKVWDAAMKEMTSRVGDFSNKCKTAFNQVASSAKEATKSVDALQKSINALKDKTVTITTKYKTVGGPARFGGARIGYAREGDSWIQDRPTNIGGMNVSEGSKPELITVTPLSNPYDMSDKSINLGRLSGNGGTTAGGTPVSITGDIYVTVKTANGEVLANQVKPFLLSGFSGIT